MAWMFLFNIDIISNAEGQVIPAGDVKTIQHLEGGIIDQILVKESDTVKAGESLVILAATASEVDVDEAQVQMIQRRYNQLDWKQKLITSIYPFSLMS